MGSRRFIFVGCVVLIAFWGPTPNLCASDPLQIRVLCYNIHHAQGVDGRLDVQRICDVIRSADPDIVVLQEVDQNVSRSQSIDQPQRIADCLGMHQVFGANLSLQGGFYGNVLLSRFVIATHRNHLLPNHRQGEQRGVIEATLEIPGGEERLRVFATHFDHRASDTDRVASAKRINDLVAGQPSQVAILAGDLNDVLGSTTLGTLSNEWRVSNQTEQPTIPVGQPKRQIDFVLYRPTERWKVVETKVLDEPVASDHRGILAVLQLQGLTAELGH